MDLGLPSKLSILVYLSGIYQLVIVQWRCLGYTTLNLCINLENKSINRETMGEDRCGKEEQR